MATILKPRGYDAAMGTPERHDTAEMMFLRHAAGRAQYDRGLAEGAIRQLPEDRLGHATDPTANPVGVLMKHIGGNLKSRWTDFLTTDGEKPWRNRDTEFDIKGMTPKQIWAVWNDGWSAYLTTLASLTPDDLTKSVTIRGQKHDVIEAVLRTMTHVGYHVGQIVMTCRAQIDEADWQTLTIARGGSAAYNQQAWGDDELKPTSG